jgi:hypothetical protein
VLERRVDGAAGQDLLVLVDGERGRAGGALVEGEDDGHREAKRGAGC